MTTLIRILATFMLAFAIGFFSNIATWEIASEGRWMVGGVVFAIGVSLFLFSIPKERGPLNALASLSLPFCLSGIITMIKHLLPDLFIGLSVAVIAVVAAAMLYWLKKPKAVPR